MISISPHIGQFTWSILSPNSQNAGQIPGPVGVLILASNLPYVWLNKPLVLILAEV